MKFLLIIFTVMLGACATNKVWHNPKGATDQEFARTIVDCKVKQGQSDEREGHNPWWPFVKDQPSVFELCMRGEGYERTK